MVLALGPESVDDARLEVLGNSDGDGQWHPMAARS